MKLYERKNITEDEKYLSDVFVSHGTRAEGGWYIKIEFPLTINKQHVNPETFESVTGPMRYNMVFRYRPANDHRDAPVKHLLKGWFPA